MNRPLLITDCDEVLLHMVAHFQEWLGEEHDIDFAFETGDFAEALTYRQNGEAVAHERVWPLLTDFFRGEMHRQTLTPGALEALGRIGEAADIVILTNLGDEAHSWRVEATSSVFVDDLPVHHASVAKHSPDTWRLHMVAEPRLAPAVPTAPEAHARIDDWATATDWILERLKSA